MALFSDPELGKAAARTQLRNKSDINDNKSDTELSYKVACRCVVTVGRLKQLKRPILRSTDWMFR